MREALFIKKNKERWERLQNAPPTDADDMAKDFIRLVDDLAYAKTFYASSKITQFINSLAARFYLNIYQNRKEESSRLIAFWKYDLPLTIYSHYKIIVFTFILFAVFFAVGFFSAQNDEMFVRQVLGNGYVDMTEKNIAEGNPFGVYQSGSPFLTWMGIMINNIIVSFMYFVKGIFFGILTISSIVKEAIRIGAFEQFFFARGMGLQSVLTVFIHGTLEIAAIIFAGAAGIVMGTSFLFPGTHTRLNALKTGTKDGVKMVIGLVPIFILAAFFEGYVTRHYKMPMVISISILLISMLFLIGYFIIYPIRLSRRLASGKNQEVIG
ncbi:MAG: stage II sporulation protein M [Chitinophagaceae bacterium]|nr:stage II sporulation protein M [Chitinophagaceae bacterium]